MRGVVCRWGDSVRHGQGLDVVAPKTGMSRLTLRLDGAHSATYPPNLTEFGLDPRCRICAQADDDCCCLCRLGLGVLHLRGVACWLPSERHGCYLRARPHQARHPPNRRGHHPTREPHRGHHLNRVESFLRTFISAMASVVHR